MEIKTKFNVGDRVFFMHDNSVTSGIVGRIAVEIEMKEGKSAEKGAWVNEKYGLLMGNLVPKACDKHSNDLFPSKEDLLKTL